MIFLTGLTDLAVAFAVIPFLFSPAGFFCAFVVLALLILIFK